MTSPFSFPPPSMTIPPQQRFKFFVSPPYFFPPPYPSQYFSNPFFAPMQFPQFPSLNSPFKTLPPIPTFQCPYCANVCISSSDLMIHMTWHRQQLQYRPVISSGEIPAAISSISSSSTAAQIKDPKAMISSSSSSCTTALSGPRTRSPQITACKCSICGKAFTRHWLLQGHMRTHTGEKPFQCPICEKAFADKSNLRAHIQTHSGVKPYACQRCGKRFALKSYLSKHEESTCIRSIIKSKKNS